eukprot:831134-Heterocapsa_arctica.AAC.1
MSCSATGTGIDAAAAIESSKPSKPVYATKRRHHSAQSFSLPMCLVIFISCLVSTRAERAAAMAADHVEVADEAADAGGTGFASMRGCGDERLAWGVAILVL